MHAETKQLKIDYKFKQDKLSLELTSQKVIMNDFIFLKFKVVSNAETRE